MIKPSKDPIICCDHAVLRYLERAMGLNIDLVREHILTICGGAAAFGAVCVRAEGLRFEIDGNRIVTVTPDHVTPNRTGQELAMRRTRG
jgi:CobQ-like glutamine amidotransferase family enzyme